MVWVRVLSLYMPSGLEKMYRSPPLRWRSLATVLPGRVQPKSHSTLPLGRKVPWSSPVPLPPKFPAPPACPPPVAAQMCVLFAVMAETWPLTKPGRSTIFCMPFDDRLETWLYPEAPPACPINHCELPLCHWKEVTDDPPP